MRHLRLVLLLLIPISGFSQITPKDLAQKILNIKHMPYICHGFEVGKFGCGDSTFWEIVQLKDEAVNPLIELLADTTETRVPFPNFGGQMTVADIAAIALGEIIQPLPNPDEFYEIETIAGSQWMGNIDWLKSDPNNRANYCTSIRLWYKKNKDNLEWVESNSFACGDIGGSKNHPNKGHYALKSK